MEGSVNVDATADPDDIVYEPHYDNFDEDEEVYAVVELGADNKPRYLLSKIHNFLYTTSNDVRREENGQYVSRKEKDRTKVEESKYVWPTPPTSVLSSNSTSSGGLRKKITSAIRAVQHYRKAVMRRGFREMRDGASSTASKTTSGSSK